MKKIIFLVVMSCLVTICQGQIADIKPEETYFLVDNVSYVLDSHTFPKYEYQGVTIKAKNCAIEIINYDSCQIVVGKFPETIVFAFMKDEISLLSSSCMNILMIPASGEMEIEKIGEFTIIFDPEKVEILY